jgi:hypothetical protein
VENFSFISALIGSFITAVFSYSAWLIQKYIVMRSERKRLAFFYLVKICEISAIKKSAESVFKDEFTELKNKVAGLKDMAGNNKYIGHMIYVAISELLNNHLNLISDNSKLFINNFGNIIKKIRFYNEVCFGYKIDDEMVSKFPQSAILNYHFLIGYLRQLQTAMETWILSFEQSDFKIYTPEYLYGQIVCVKNIFESTESLINSLAQESGIKKKDVDDIIAKQVKEYSAKAMQSKVDKKITDFFLELLKNKKSTLMKDDIGNTGNTQARPI